MANELRSEFLANVQSLLFLLHKLGYLTVKLLRGFIMIV